MTCHAHFTYFKCKVHVGEDDSIVARGCESATLWLGLNTKTTWLGLGLGRDSHGLALEKAHTGHESQSLV